MLVLGFLGSRFNNKVFRNLLVGSEAFFVAFRFCRLVLDAFVADLLFFFYWWKRVANQLETTHKSKIAAGV